MFKKYLCLMLCVLLALSTLSTAAFAANYAYSVNNLSASAVTFEVGGNAVIDLPTTVSNVTAKVSVTNSGASAQGVVFWIGKYVDGVLVDVAYCSDTSVAASATEELSATINNVKKETETVGTTTYDSVVLKAYVWTSTGKAIAKEATLPNIGTGLKFLKNGAPIAATDIKPAFNEFDTDYSILLKREPAEFASFRMVSGDNTVTIVQPDTYNLTGKNVVTVTKKVANAETGVVEDETTTYTFNIAYEAPSIAWNMENSIFTYGDDNKVGKLVEYVEDDVFSAGDAFLVNRGGSEGETYWYATAIGSKLRGLSYIRGRNTSKANEADDIAATARMRELKTNGQPLFSFTPTAAGTIYVVAAKEIDLSSAYTAATAPGGAWTSLNDVDGHKNGSPLPFPADYSSAVAWIRAKDMTDVNSEINVLEPPNAPYGFYSWSGSGTTASQQTVNTNSFMKTFNAGEPVLVPSPGGVGYVPTYFIAWEMPTPPDMDNADITSASYSVDSTRVTLTAAEFVQEGTSNVYIATKNLLEAATIADFGVVLAESGASMTALPTEAVTFEANENEKTITLTTVTSMDATVTKVYKIKFIIPPPDPTDATIKSVTYNVGETPDSLTAADFRETSANVYEADRELPKGTTALTNVVVEALQEVATVAGVPATITFGASELSKTVTIATITSGDTTNTITYKINFTLPVNVRWSVPEAVAELPYKYVEYVEGDTFSVGDGLMVNRGGTEGGTSWYATAIGTKLLGLDYIRGRDLGNDSIAAAGGVASANIKSTISTLKNNKTPLLSFTANVGGTIYAVGIHGSHAKLADFTDANKLPAGGAWTSLNGVDGHVFGDARPDHTTQSDYIAETDTDFATYMNRKYSTESAAKAIHKDITVWPNNISMSDKPYGFATYANESKGYKSKPGYAYAYKKTFNAGDTVNIPAINDGTYVPMYFIKWDIPAADPTDASIKSVSYVANATSMSLAAANFSETSANIYEANVTLPAGTTTLSSFVVEANEPAVDAENVPTSITFAAGERAKTVTIATITSDDGSKTNTYKVNFTVPISIIWDTTNTTFEHTTGNFRKLVEYVEGDTFSPNDGPLVNRGGSETKQNSQQWKVTAIGSKLRGLEYIRGLNTSSSSDKQPYLDELQRLKDNNLPMISFTADSAGTLYAVSKESLDSVYVSGNPVGGAWTSLDGVDGQVNGSGTPLSGDAWKEWIQSAENADLETNVNAPIHQMMPENGPYSCFTYSRANDGFLYPQIAMTYAYKKEFVAGQKVDIPSPGIVGYVPMYFIKWADSTQGGGGGGTTPPTPALSDDASIKTVTYKADAADMSLAAAAFSETSANVYEANVTLAVNTSLLSDFYVTANDANATVTLIQPTAVPFAANETTKTVEIATIKSQDGSKTYTYKINFTNPAPTVSITWHEQAYTEYMEDPFGPTTRLYGDNTGWYATAVGAKLRGLDFIRPKAKTYTAPADGQLFMSFTANEKGTLYVVSEKSLDASYVNAENIVGGAWTSLDGYSGQENGTDYMGVDISADANIDTDLGACWGAMDEWIRSSENIGIKDDPTVPVNAYMPTKVPYGFTAFGTYAEKPTNTGYTVYYTYGYAYKKDFNAGEKVDVPAPMPYPAGARYTPLYFIKWGEPTDTPDTPDTPVVGDELISGFSYSVDGGAATAVSFATYDIDRSYSQIIDINLAAGSKEVAISDIVDVAGAEGYTLATVPTTVDVSGGKGIVEFDATYTDGTETKTNYYIVRFMVAAPTITDFTSSIDSTKFELVNKPLDVLATDATSTWSPYKDSTHNSKAGMPFAFVGEEMNNSYVLIRHVRNAGSSTNGVVTGNGFSASENPDEDYMYTFTAPEKGRLIIAGYDPTSNAADLTAAGYTQVTGVTTGVLDTVTDENYTFETNTYWHSEGQTAKTYEYTSTNKNGTEEALAAGLSATATYRTVKEVSVGIPTLYTQPYNYVVASDYYVSNYVTADTTSRNSWKVYKYLQAQAGSTEFATAETDFLGAGGVRCWRDMLSAYKQAPAKNAEPKFVNSDNMFPNGLQASVQPLQYVYTKEFNAGDTVNIPFWYAAASAKWNPVVFVQWGKESSAPALSNDASASALKVDGADKLADCVSNALTVNLAEDDAEAVIELVATDANATVTYAVDTVAVANGTVAVDNGATKTLTATITAQDGTTTETYTITITRAAATTDNTTVYVGGEAVFKQFATETFGSDKALITYVDGAFGTLDKVNLDSSWYASAIGEGFRKDNLSYFIGRRTDGSGRTAQKDAIKALADENESIFQFEALKSGTIYVVSPTSLDDTYMAADVVGGAWTSLDGINGHTNGGVVLDHTTQANYQAFADALANAGEGGLDNPNKDAGLTSVLTDNVIGYLNYTYVEADFFKAENIDTYWPHNASVSNKPYGFVAYAGESLGITQQPTYGYAYKKVFNADDIVKVPASLQSYSPVYIIDWTTPVITPTLSNDAKLSKLVYTVGTDATENAVTGFAIADEEGTYNVTLPEGTTSVTVNAVANHNGATVTYAPAQTVEFATDALAKTVTVTVGAEDRVNTNIYEINFTVPAPVVTVLAGAIFDHEDADSTANDKIRTYEGAPNGSSFNNLTTQNKHADAAWSTDIYYKTKNNEAKVTDTNEYYYLKTFSTKMIPDSSEYETTTFTGDRTESNGTVKPNISVTYIPGDDAKNYFARSYKMATGAVAQDRYASWTFDSSKLEAGKTYDIYVKGAGQHQSHNLSAFYAWVKDMDGNVVHAADNDSTGANGWNGGTSPNAMKPHGAWGLFIAGDGGVSVKATTNAGELSITKDIASRYAAYSNIPTKLAKTIYIPTAEEKAAGKTDPVLYLASAGDFTGQYGAAASYDHAPYFESIILVEKDAGLEGVAEIEEREQRYITATFKDASGNEIAKIYYDKDMIGKDIPTKATYMKEVALNADAKDNRTVLDNKDLASAMTAPAGYVFTGWSNDGKLAATDMVYTPVYVQNITDALITGFSYKADNAAKVATTFAEHDANTDGTYSAVIDIDLAAGAKEVEISDIVDISGVVASGYTLNVTPSTKIVDVSGGKGSVEFYAEYNDGTETKKNYYIVRFMVAAPAVTITTPTTLVEGTDYVVHNTPTDEGQIWYKDKTNWYSGYLGKELYNSYLLISPKRDGYAATYKDTYNNGDGTYSADYMYKFAAPQDGTIYLTSNATANNHAELIEAGFEKIDTMSLDIMIGRTSDYTYERTNFWHVAGTEFEGYNITRYLNDLESGEYKDTKHSYTLGDVSADAKLLTIYTKPFDYVAEGTEANAYAENYVAYINHPADSWAKAYWKLFKEGKDKFVGTLPSNSDDWEQMLAAYEADPLNVAKPKYIESNNAIQTFVQPDGTYLGNYGAMNNVVYRKVFKEGQDVEIPFYHNTDKDGARNPVVFVSWEELSDDATIKSVSVDGVVVENADVITITEDSAKILAVPNNSNAFVKYSVNGTIDNDGIIDMAAGDEKAVLVTVEAEDGSGYTTFTVTLVKPASSDATAASLTVNGADVLANVVDNAYTVELAADVAEAAIVLTATDANATVTYADASSDAVIDNTVAVEPGETKVVKVTITAQDGATTNVYTITIVRVDSTLSNDGSIEYVRYTVDEGTPSEVLAAEFVPSSSANREYIANVTLPVDAQLLSNFEVGLPTDSLATVTYKPTTVVVAAGDSKTVVVAEITAQNGTVNTYKIIFEVDLGIEEDVIG